MLNPLTKFAIALATMSSSALLLAIPSAEAISVKADPLAAKGCTQRVTMKEANAAIKRYNLHTRNARSGEVRTLGTALTWIEKLNDGEPLDEAVADDGYSYNFQSATRNSHQAYNEIRVNRNGKKNYGENVAQLVHELGHMIGNRPSLKPHKEDEDIRIYNDYVDATDSKYCNVSPYSLHNHHEQFAEVFAAFVTRPELIKQNDTPACRAAFKFFATKIFAGAGPKVLNCMEHQKAILNKLNASNARTNATSSKPRVTVSTNAKAPISSEIAPPPPPPPPPPRGAKTTHLKPLELVKPAPAKADDDSDDDDASNDDSAAAHSKKRAAPVVTNPKATSESPKNSRPSANAHADVTPAPHSDQPSSTNEAASNKAANAAANKPVRTNQMPSPKT